jgi:hypothetical protein
MSGFFLDAAPGSSTTLQIIDVEAEEQGGGSALSIRYRVQSDRARSVKMELDQRDGLSDEYSNYDANDLPMEELSLETGIAEGVLRVGILPGYSDVSGTLVAVTG